MPPETFVGVGGSPSTNKKTTDFSVAFLLVERITSNAEN